MISFEEAIKVLEANYPDKCYGQLCEAVDIAIKSIKAWDKIDKDLKTIMEGDTRSFYTNQPTADAQYYDGIYNAIKVIERYFEEDK